MNKTDLNNSTNDLRSKAVSSSFWGFLDKGIGILVHFFIGIVLARLLPPADFGLIGLGLVVVGFGQIFVNLGLGPSLIQKQNLTERHVRVVFTTSVIAGILLATLVFLGAPLAAYILENENVVSIVKALSVIFILGGFQIPSQALLKKRLDFRHIFYVSLVKSIMYGIITISLAIYGLGVWSLVIGNIIQRLINFLGSFWYVRHSLKPLFAKKEFLDLAHFGSGMTLSGIFNYFALQGDYLMVGKLLGASALGLYTKAYSLMQMPTTQFVSVLSDVLFPTASSIQNDTNRIANVFLKAIRSIAFITIPVCTLMVMLSQEIVVGLYGSQWTGAVLPLQILGIFGVFRATYSASSAFLRAKGWVYQIFGAQVLYGVSIMTGVWFGAKYYGIAGAATAVGFSILIMWIMIMELISRSISINWKDIITSFVPGIVISLSFGIPIYFIKQLLLFWGIPVFLNLIILVTFSLLLLVTIVLLLPQNLFSNLPSEILLMIRPHIPNSCRYNYNILLKILQK